MAFNASENIVTVENPAIGVGSGPIQMDGSSLSEVTYMYQTNTAPVISDSTGQSAYNGIEALFDVKIPAQARVLFDKSYIKINGFACDGSVSLATAVPLGVSVPWNTIAAVLQTAEVKLNQNATTTEQITQNLGDGSMAKILTRYSREVIENMGDSFFVPCFEETRDVLGTSLVPGPGGAAATTGLSDVSQARRTSELIETGPVVRPHAKNIYLGDLFDSLRIPAAFYLQQLQLRIRPKLATDILIVDSLCVWPQVRSDFRYYVTGMKLYLTMVTLTENQLAIEREKIMSNQSILRTAFNSFDALQKTHSQGASYRDSNVKNMQAAIMMFPSSLSADGIGVNRYQYNYGTAIDGVADGGGISSYQMRYDNIYSPGTPQTVNTTAFATNTELFANYRLLCKKMWERDITPALRFLNMAPEKSVASDLSTYVMFCSQFYPQESYGHKTMAGSDHEIITSGGGNEPVIIVRIRLSFLEIRGDTSVYMIN